MFTLPIIVSAKTHLKDKSLRLNNR